MGIELRPLKRSELFHTLKQIRGALYSICSLLHETDLNELAESFSKSRVAERYAIVPDGYL